MNVLPIPTLSCTIYYVLDLGQCFLYLIRVLGHPLVTSSSPMHYHKLNWIVAALILNNFVVFLFRLKLLKFQVWLNILSTPIIPQCKSNIFFFILKTKAQFKNCNHLIYSAQIKKPEIDSKVFFFFFFNYSKISYFF